MQVIVKGSTFVYMVLVLGIASILTVTAIRQVLFFTKLAYRWC